MKLPGPMQAASGRFFRRFLVALLLVNISTVAALTWVAYSHSVTSLTNHARSSIAQQVDILADKFDKEYRLGLERTVLALASSENLDDYLLASGAERFVIRRRIERTYQRISADSPTIGALTFVDDEGRVVVDVRDGRRRRDRASLATLAADAATSSPTLRATQALYVRLEQIPLLLFSGNMEWFMPRVEHHLTDPVVVGPRDVRVVAGLSKLDVDTGFFGGIVFVEQRFDEWLAELRGLEFFGVNPVWVLGANGETLGAPGDEGTLLDPRSSLPAGFAPTTQLLATDDGIIGYRDLTLSPGRPFFRIVVALPQAALVRDLAPAVDFFTGVVAAMIVLICALSWWVTGYLVRPVMELERTQGLLAHAHRLAQLGHWEVGASDDRIHLSDQAAVILGRPPGQSIARAEFIEHVAPQDRARVVEAIASARGGQESTAGMEHAVVRPDGEERFVHHVVGVESGDDGRTPRLAGTLRDITERRRAEDQIESLAYFDQVTGLANRTMLNRSAALAVENARANGHAMALVFLDLDHFKRVNDTAGHDAGDELLRQVGERLRRTLRTGDAVGLSPEAADLERSVARFGGDEFIVLLDRLSSRSAADTVASRICESLVEPFEVFGRRLYVTGSLGIAVYPEDGQTVAELLRHADTAMYHVKNSGRNDSAFFDSSMDAEVTGRMALETRLHQAVGNGEFSLHFQPRVDLRTEEVVSLEALIRWRVSDEQWISPAEFIPVAEECGLIVPIGEWVITEACREAATWPARGLPARVSINISPRQFTSDGLVDVLSRALDRFQLAPERVELEMTESVLFENVERGVAIARELKRLGVTLSVDDFGTGYSSLSMLKNFPVDTLKIDKSFVSDVPVDADDASIVEAALQLGHNLGLRVVAEGVETMEQYTFLRDRGCHEGQGFLFARAVPPAALGKVLGELRMRA